MNRSLHAGTNAACGAAADSVQKVSSANLLERLATRRNDKVASYNKLHTGCQMTGQPNAQVSWVVVDPLCKCLQNFKALLTKGTS